MVCPFLTRTALPCLGILLLMGTPRVITAEETEPQASSQLRSSSYDQVIWDLWKGGQHRKAFKQINRWKDKDKTDPAPYVVEAQLRFEQGKYKKCIKLCKKALKKSPRYPEAFYWRARGYEARGQLLEAMNEYEAALRARKDYPEAAIGLNRVKQELQLPSQDARVE
jgi:tetratricopeptide (TPR) repeat protein